MPSPNVPFETKRRRKDSVVITLVIGIFLFNIFSFFLNIWMLHSMEVHSPGWVLDHPNTKSTEMRTLKDDLLPMKSLNESTTEELSDLDYVHEMPPVLPTEVYMIIPSVPRKENADYLLQVLASLSGFSQSNVYVFHNGKPGQEHQRWEEARALYPKMHFVRNEAPVPPGHPSIYNISLPLPAHIQASIERYNDTQVAEARNDTLTRIEWRRKECHDFTVMVRYILSVIEPNRLENAWVIFNQDDAQWKGNFEEIYNVLAQASTPRVDLNKDGLVSVGFRANILKDVVDYADIWCDFKPVDWVVWTFFTQRGFCSKCAKPKRKLVVHIGEISSRHGRVEGAEEEDRLRKEEAKKRAQELREKRKRMAAAQHRVVYHNKENSGETKQLREPE